MAANVGAIGAAALIALFSASAFAKIAYWDEVQDWLNDLLPKFNPAAMAGFATAGEIVLVLGIPILPRAAATAALIWVLGASAMLLWGRRRVSSCGCFGLRQRLGWPVAVRNSVALLLAASILVAPATISPDMVLAAIVAGVGGIALRDAMHGRNSSASRVGGQT